MKTKSNNNLVKTFVYRNKMLILQRINVLNVLTKFNINLCKLYMIMQLIKKFPNIFKIFKIFKIF